PPIARLIGPLHRLPVGRCGGTQYRHTAKTKSIWALRAAPERVSLASCFRPRASLRRGGGRRRLASRGRLLARIIPREVLRTAAAPGDRLPAALYTAALVARLRKPAPLPCGVVPCTVPFAAITRLFAALVLARQDVGQAFSPPETKTHRAVPG